MQSPASLCKHSASSRRFSRRADFAPACRQSSATALMKKGFDKRKNVVIFNFIRFNYANQMNGCDGRKAFPLPFEPDSFLGVDNEKW